MPTVPENSPRKNDAPAPVSFSPPAFPTDAMENPVDRTIRRMALAAGVIGLLVIVVLQYL